MEREDFEVVLKSHLRRRGYTQGQVARVLKVSASTVTKWLRGSNKIPYEHVSKLSELLELEEPDRREFFELAGYPLPSTRSADLTHVVTFPLLPLDRRKVQVALFNGSVMIMGKEAELALRITNATDRPLEKIDIELTRSAEYDLLTPSSQSITSLPPLDSVDVYFKLNMKVARQVSINYLVNGEMQDPPLSVYASRDNPYIYGNPVDRGDFFGRQEELRAIIQAVTKPVKQDILVVGERRSGKTSLLYQCIKHLVAPFIPVYITLNTCQPHADDVLDHVLYKLIQRLVERQILDSVWQKPEFASNDFLSRLDEVIQAARRVVQDLHSFCSSMRLIFCWKSERNLPPLHLLSQYERGGIKYE
jgi:transcriptional regulator with XRE-family HTH domain